ASVADALHAEGALLHDAARPDRHVGVLEQLEARDAVLLLGEVQEVEAPHLVGAVVRAVAGADAAGINHVVEAFIAVSGGLDGADDLARGRLAVLAGDWLEVPALRRVFLLADGAEVGADAYPVHLAGADDLLLADDGDVVLRLAGDDAGAAADARR